MRNFMVGFLVTTGVLWMFGLYIAFGSGMPKNTTEAILEFMPVVCFMAAAMWKKN